MGFNMTCPILAYINVAPVVAGVVFRSAIDSNPEAIVIGTYDSGKIPISLCPLIKEATGKRIPVFGIYEIYSTLKQVDITHGVEHPHIFQPEALNAGLIPLQIYPRRLLELGERQRELLKEYPEFEPIKSFSVSIGGVRLVEKLMKGIVEICKETDKYEERITRVRKQFSLPEFNRLVDEKINEAFLIYHC